MKNLNLNNPNIMSANDAAKIWGKNESYVRNSVRQNPEKWPDGSYRQFGHTVVVTAEGMEQVTGLADPRLAKYIVPQEGIDFDQKQQDHIIKMARSKAGELKNKRGGLAKEHYEEAFAWASVKEAAEIPEPEVEKYEPCKFLYDSSGLEPDAGITLLMKSPSEEDVKEAWRIVSTKSSEGVSVAEAAMYMYQNGYKVASICELEKFGGNIKYGYTVGVPFGIVKYRELG